MYNCRQHRQLAANSLQLKGLMRLKIWPIALIWIYLGRGHEKFANITRYSPKDEYSENQIFNLQWLKVTLLKIPCHD